MLWAFVSPLSQATAYMRISRVATCTSGKWHPHGFVSYVPSFLMGAMARAGQPHDREWFGTCAPLLFKIPGLAEVLMRRHFFAHAPLGTS